MQGTGLSHSPTHKSQGVPLSSLAKSTHMSGREKICYILYIWNCFPLFPSTPHSLFPPTRMPILQILIKRTITSDMISRRSDCNLTSCYVISKSHSSYNSLHVLNLFESLHSIELVRLMWSFAVCEVTAY